MNWLTPPPYVVIDLETVAGDPVEAEEWMRRAWSPNPTWKPATIGDRFLQAYEKKKEQLALLDSAPIISVAMKTPTDCRLIHHLPCDPVFPGIAIRRCADEREMLRDVAAHLASLAPETVLIGHNILHFDLPKLRQRMLRCGVPLPVALVDREQPVFDTMREWSRFTLDDRQYIGLSELLEICNIEDYKAILTGAAVPELYREGRYAEILAYATADVLAEWQLFLLMTGQMSRDASVPQETMQQPATSGDEAPAGELTTRTVTVDADALEVVLRKLGVE